MSRIAIPVRQLISEAQVLRQPRTTVNLNPLSPAQFRGTLAQASQLGFPDNQYQSRSRTAAAGKYQLNWQQLRQLGLLLPVQLGLSETQLNFQLLGNPIYWTGKFDLRSVSDFLNNPAVQEMLVQMLWQQNHQQMQKVPGFSQSSAEHQAGILLVAHWSGLDQARAVLAGTSTASTRLGFAATDVYAAGVAAAQLGALLSI